MVGDRAATLARLRGMIQATGASCSAEPTVTRSTGIAALDSLIRGWPCPGLVELTGPVGAGRLGLILPAMAAETAAGRVVGVVDVLARLYPPGLRGLSWSHLLLVRPGGDRALWAAEQMAASGAVAMTVLLDPLPVGRAGYRLLRAAERGRSLLVLVGEQPDFSSPSSIRLCIRSSGPGGLLLDVLKNGPGRRARQARIRLERADPVGQRSG